MRATKKSGTMSDYEMIQCDFCGEWYEYESEGKDDE